MKQKLLLISLILCLVLMGFATSNVTASSGIAAYYIGPGELYVAPLDGADRCIVNNTTYTLFIPARTLAEQQSFLNNLPSGFLATRGSPFTDSRDGNAYCTVQIGTQIWMAENLNYNTGSSECPANDPAKCDTYGRLYDWPTAMTACPSGWKLPTDAELYTLENYFASGTCNATRASGWDCSPAGTALISQTGFGALMTGYRYYTVAYGHSHQTMFWSTTSYNQNNEYAWLRLLDSTNDRVLRLYSNKGDHVSVRCLKE